MKVTDEKFKQWGEAFLKANTRTLQGNESINLMALMSSERKGAPDPELAGIIASSAAARIAQDRARQAGVTLSPQLSVAIGMFSPNPGVAVMWGCAMAYLARVKGVEEVNLFDHFVHAFPMGVPTQDALFSMWDMQKEGGANMLDMLEA